MNASEAAAFCPASDQSLLVTLGSEIHLDVHRRVIQLLQSLQAAKLPGVVNLHPAYCSLLIRFDSLATSHAALESHVRTLLDPVAGEAPVEPRLVEIPVRYGGEFGPDLEEVAATCGMSPQDVIELHASVIYNVYFLGFVPGFAYMGRLPSPIMVPRLDQPRKHVPRGSVAIANDHTAIYSMATPGGWRLLGRTDAMLFDPERANLSLLNPGDTVRFRPVDS